MCLCNFVCCCYWETSYFMKDTPSNRLRNHNCLLFHFLQSKQLVQPGTSQDPPQAASSTDSAGELALLRKKLADYRRENTALRNTIATMQGVIFVYVYFITWHQCHSYWCFLVIVMFIISFLNEHIQYRIISIRLWSHHGLSISDNSSTRPFRRNHLSLVIL